MPARLNGPNDRSTAVAFDLNALATKTAICKVEFMGQSALVTYNPSILTANNIATARKVGDEGFVNFFSELVTDWDVKRGTKKVPINMKGLTALPMPLLKAIFVEIMGHSGKDDEEGKASSGG
jgi:hypothetical protein